jgi:hypothetical protein
MGWLFHGIRSVLVTSLRATVTLPIIRGRRTALVLAVCWFGTQISTMRHVIRASWALRNILVSEIGGVRWLMWRTGLRRRCHVRRRGISIGAFQCSEITALNLGPD